MSAFRIGIGHDTHRLAGGGPLVLGGITIPHDHHAVGYSDADALLHAVSDALLGAASMGDIGEMFPDDDLANEGRNSADMLRDVHYRVSEAGWEIANVDCIVHAQRPKISPHKEAIRRRIAQILGIEPGQVNVKAKTGEQVGPVGSEQAIQAQCVVLLIHEDVRLI